MRLTRPTAYLAAAVAGIACAATLIAPASADALVRSHLKGARGGNFSGEFVYGKPNLPRNDLDVAFHIRIPNLRISHIPRRKFLDRFQNVCVTRRLRYFGGTHYETLAPWRVEWQEQTRCRLAGPSGPASFPSFWVAPESLGSYHFEAIVEWRDPLSERVISRQRFNYNQVREYRCLDDEDASAIPCRTGVQFRNVTAITFNI